MNVLLVAGAISFFVFYIDTPATAQTFPDCSSASADSDGDGWGWEYNRSCVITQQRISSESVEISNNVERGLLALFPTCRTAASDSDNDGYGFEDGQSCIVQGSNPAQENSVTNNSPAAVADSSLLSFPQCRSAATDHDNDGYGYEDGRSCLVPAAGADTGPEVLSAFPVCRSAGSDSDNDGYGFEEGRSCLVQTSSSLKTDSGEGSGEQSGITIAGTYFPYCQNAAVDSDGDGYGWENGRSCVTSASANSAIPATNPGDNYVYTVSDLTDVVLVTGQSNVLGLNTGYDAGLDQPDSQVFAYTNSGWAVADLHQSWDRFQYPGNQAAIRRDGHPSNSFAFHFGKRLVQRDSSRVVGFIVVPDPGKGISNWDYGSVVYRHIQDKVARALAEIPHKYTIDAILWHQGENDWLFEGTADDNPTGFTSENSYEYRNYYQIKLSALINNFRNEPWASSQTGFICGETRRAEGVNRRLNALNYDNDPYTACVRGSDLPKRADDAIGSHFSAEGLRTLGRRYADQYFEISSR